MNAQTIKPVTISKLLTYQEAADILGVHRQSIVRYVKSGELRTTKLGGGRPKIHPEDLRAFVEGSRDGG